jgi:hypothetical protein
MSQFTFSISELDVTNLTPFQTRVCGITFWIPTGVAPVFNLRTSVRRYSIEWFVAVMTVEFLVIKFLDICDGIEMIVRLIIIIGN